MADSATTASEPRANRLPNAAASEADPIRAEQPPVLEIDNLTAGYGDLAAVRDVSLTVRRGEIVALFGANGAGKTTTLKAAVGALTRMGGDVRWSGRTSKDPLHRLAAQGVGFVPEERSIISGLTARDNLRIGRGRIDRAIELFPELEPLLDRSAGLLSGGQQQMLALARVLAADPVAIVVDELSLGLAPLVVERLLDVLRTEASERGVAVLLVEQQAKRAMAVGDRWYLLAGGRIATAGDCADGVGALRAAFRSTLGGVSA
jgi:branched-chain amino acid transport system ATP-binding protein